jgi:hypothetical protein
MKVKWTVFLTKAGFWLIAEIGLSLLELDNLADYSEFLFEQDITLSSQHNQMIKISSAPPEFCVKVNEFCPKIKLISHKGNYDNFYRRYTYLFEDKSHSAIFKTKCKKLENPCIKVLCLSKHQEHQA